ncbi:MAG: hypothetical protein R3E39_12190 [Anaerolineae bacterium]
MRIYILGLLLVFMTAACGGNTSQLATRAPVPTVNVGDLAAGTFKATVGGAVNGEFSGSGSYIRAVNGGFLLNVSGVEGIAGAAVSIVMPEGIAPGVHALKSYFDAVDSEANKITSVGASFSSISADGSSIDVYSTVSEGTLTLQSVDPMTGSFAFKGALEAGGTVQVTGTFNQLTLVLEE